MDEDLHNLQVRVARAAAAAGHGHDRCRALTREVALKLGVSLRRKEYRQGGEVALRAKPRPLRSRLKPLQLQRLEGILLKAPRSSGCTTELWTLQRVADVIERHFGVRYDPLGVWHVLTRMGWSCQKPERRARERDEDAMVRSRKQDWHE